MKALPWVEALRNQKEFLESLPPSLRHGVKIVPVSLINQQVYCEKQVDLRLLHGEIDTPTKAKGRELHKELIPTKKVTLEDIIEGIRSGERYAAIAPLYGNVEGLPIRGVPDVVLFHEARPVSVVELKTTKKATPKIWDNERIQAEIYGLLLHEMGFDTTHMLLAVAKYWGEEPENLFHVAVKKEIRKVLESGGPSPDGANVKFPAGYLELFSFNHDKALDTIRGFRGFWTGEREPIASPTPGKCRPCVYNPFCDEKAA